MATIKDVAKHAGVTIGTVSRVLNNKKWVSEDCRKKVQVAIKDLHYKPQAHARRLRQKHSRICGLIAPHHTAIFRSPFFTSIIEGIEEVAAEKQYRLLLHPLNETARAQVSYRALLGDGSVDGMFVLNAWSTDASIRELAEANVPFVLVNGKITGQEDMPYVGFDNKKGVQKAVEYLAGLGHERIGIINGRMTTTNALERFQGFPGKPLGRTAGVPPGMDRRRGFRGRGRLPGGPENFIGGQPAQRHHLRQRPDGHGRYTGLEGKRGLRAGGYVHAGFR